MLCCHCCRRCCCWHQVETDKRVCVHCYAICVMYTYVYAFGVCVCVWMLYLVRCCLRSSVRGKYIRLLICVACACALRWSSNDGGDGGGGGSCKVACSNGLGGGGGSFFSITTPHTQAHMLCCADILVGIHLCILSPRHTHTQTTLHACLRWR